MSVCYVATLLPSMMMGRRPVRGAVLPTDAAIGKGGNKTENNTLHLCIVPYLHTYRLQYILYIPYLIRIIDSKKLNLSQSCHVIQYLLN
jgi:hypothetical protein